MESIPFEIPSLNDYIHMYNNQGASVVFADFRERQNQMYKSAKYVECDDEETLGAVNSDHRKQMNLLRKFLFHITKVDEKVSFHKQSELWTQTVTLGTKLFHSNRDRISDWETGLHEAILILIPKYRS
jgi:hypothetical protein